jgi:hypothetical protein
MSVLRTCITLVLEVSTSILMFLSHVPPLKMAVFESVLTQQACY